MAPQHKVTATEEQLKSFDWLPLEQWNVDKTFNYYGVAGKKLCKICDKWVGVSNLSVHVKKHRDARKRLAKKEREQALEKAREARRLKKKERSDK